MLKISYFEYKIISFLFYSTYLTESIFLSKSIHRSLPVVCQNAYKHGVYLMETGAGNRKKNIDRFVPYFRITVI